MAARRCSAKKLSKISQNSQKIPVLESLSSTVKYTQAVWLATLLKGDPRTGVSEPAVCRSFAK